MDRHGQTWMDMDGYASDIGMDHPGLLTFSLWHHDPPPGCFPDDAVNDLAKLLPRIISQGMRDISLDETLFDQSNIEDH